MVLTSPGEDTASGAVHWEILGGAGWSWCGFGDLQLLSWLLLSWHMSIEWFCKMWLPRK